jgi:4-hydroxy-tetrahydrodipicolinate reductase
MIEVVVAGAAGRMGARIMDAVRRASDLDLVGALERPDHPSLGRDAGEAAGLGPLNLPLSADPMGAVTSGRVVIDFSAPDAAANHADLAAQSGADIVIGATGLTEDQLAALDRAAEKTAVVFAPNMSVGVNLLFGIVGQVAQILGNDYDMEIVETHHRMKKDAPSGTAKRLAEIMAEAVNRNLDDYAVYGRQGQVGERTAGEIGVMALRAGDIVGEHTVLFGGMGERIEITHRAHSRDTFAQGAVRAARWAAGKPAGRYDMRDVLGLR